MATINSNLTAPSAIYWVDSSVDASSQYLTKANVEYVRQGGTTLKAYWSCKHYTYQYQYRVRRRYSPAYASASGVSEDAWTEWGEWQGNDLSSDVASDTERLSWDNGNVTTQVFTLDYSFTNYDRLEYQFRARAFDEPTLGCSEWGYSTLKIVYDPVAEVLSAVRQPNGDVVLTVNTNWTRGGNRFSVGSTYADSNKKTLISDAGLKLTGVPADFEATLPSYMVGDYDRVYADLKFYTSDNSISGSFSAKYFDVSMSSEPSSTIGAPLVSVTDEGAYAQVSITRTGSTAYGEVIVTAHYVNLLGEVVYLDVSGSNLSWQIATPPYDVPVTVRATAITSGQWNYTDKAITLRSKGSYSWTSDDGDVVAMKLNVGRTSSFTVSGEVVETTADKPTARFGKGGKRRLSVSGVVADDSVADGAWLSDIEKLRVPQVWTYREPGGGRYRIRVDTVSETSAYRDSNLIASVDISMTEVA